MPNQYYLRLTTEPKCLYIFYEVFEGDEEPVLDSIWVAEVPKDKRMEAMRWMRRNGLRFEQLDSETKEVPISEQQAVMARMEIGF